MQCEAGRRGVPSPSAAACTSRGGAPRHRRASRLRSDASVLSTSPPDVGPSTPAPQRHRLDPSRRHVARTAPFEPQRDRVDAVQRRCRRRHARGADRLQRPERPGRSTLHLARYNALDQENKIGTLLVNPGGPGFGGGVLATRAPTIYDRTLSTGSTSSAGTRAARREHAGDRLRRRLRRVLRRRRHHPRHAAERQPDRRHRQASSRTLRSRRTATSSSTSAPTTRPATWT